MVKSKILDRQGVALFSSLSNYLFLPSLFFIRLGGTLSLETFKYAWIVSVVGIGSNLFNVFLSFLYLPVGKPSQEITPWFIFALSFPNSVALPLVLMASLCSQLNIEAPRHYIEQNLLEVEENTTDIRYLSSLECIEIAELYIFLYGIFIVLFIWMIAFPLLDLADHSAIRHILDPVENLALESQTSSDSNDTSSSRSIGHTMLKQLTNPTLVAQFVGLLVGLTQPLQDVFFNPDGFLSFVTAAVRIIANGALSIINLIMAASLSLKLMDLKNFRQLFGHEDIGISRRTLISLLLGRMIIFPLIGMAILYSISDLILPDDKLMELVLYLAFVTPTANMTILLAQILKRQRIAEILALSILPQYILGAVSVTAFTLGILLLLNLG